MIQELTAFLRTRRKANLCMVAANAAVFLVLSLLGNTQNVMFMLTHGACYAPYVFQGQYWRLFTSMFLHFGLLHLIYNMICLISLGDMLETAVGTVRYLGIYLISGLAGNLLSVFWESRTETYAVSAGASGAIFGVIGAVFFLMLRNRRRAGKSQLQRMAIMVVLMVFQGFTEAGTDNAAHIGGLITGFLLAAVLTMRKIK